jgi:hypothetical protein
MWFVGEMDGLGSESGFGWVIFVAILGSRGLGYQMDALSDSAAQAVERGYA